MNSTVLSFYSLLKIYLQPLKLKVLEMFLLLGISLVLQIGSPSLLGNFIDALKQGAAIDRLSQIALIFIFLGIVTQILTIGVRYLGQIISWQATNALRIDLVKHCINLDVDFHKQTTPGELVERVDGDVALLARFFSELVLQIFGNGIFLLGILVFLCFQNLRAGICLTLFAAVSLLSLISLQGQAIPAWQAYRSWSGVFYGFIGEQIAGREDIKSNGAIGFVMRQFYQILRQWLPTYQEARFSSTLLWASSVGLFTIGNALALFLAATLISQNSITLGTAYLIFYYTNLLAQPIEEIRQNLEEFQQVEASILRIQELFNLQPRVKDLGTILLANKPPIIEFRDVCFKYQKEPTLQNITFTLEAGKKLGIVGPTGSGKTTIGRLLTRLYEINSGTIVFDGIDIQKISLPELRNKVGIVTQQVQLLSANVRDNITFYDSSVSDQKILTALETIGLISWYRSLVDGLDTLLSPDRLSAGESQLLALTRIFLQEPSVIILDEASSRLDQQTAGNLEKAIDLLLQNCTAIIIAHRLETLKTVDQIMVLKNGRIIEYNDRVQLSNNPHSSYSQLLAKI